MRKWWRDLSGRTGNSRHPVCKGGKEMTVLEVAAYFDGHIA